MLLFTFCANVFKVLWVFSTVRCDWLIELNCVLSLSLQASMSFWVVYFKRAYWRILLSRWKRWMVNFFHSQLYMKVFPSRTPSKLIWVVWDPAKDTQISRKIGVWRSTLWGRRWKYKGGSVFVFLGDCVYFIDFYFSQLVSVLRCAVCTCREEKGWETEVIIFDTRLILMKPSCVISGVLGRSSYSLVCSLRL